MDRTLSLPSSLSAPRLPRKAIGVSRVKVQTTSDKYLSSPCYFISHGWDQKKCLVSSALPETAVSVVVAAVAVGAAATLLSRTTETPTTLKTSLKTCEDCGGSGLCPECKGEGFILKKLSEASADKARMTAKNMATRFTAGLPKKWSYCSKCSSARLCRACGGTGQI